MNPTEMANAKRKIDLAFGRLMGSPAQGTIVAQHARATDGKVFELLVLSDLLEQFSHHGYQVRLINGSYLKLRSVPGYVVRHEPRIVLMRQDGVHFAVWMNVQFRGIGFEGSGRSTPVAPDYHELDLAITKEKVPDGLLSRDQIFLAIECKDRPLTKGMLREMIGLRREMSLLGKPPHAGFFGWLTPIHTQNPPIHLFLCSSARPPRNFGDLSAVFGIEVQHRRL